MASPEKAIADKKAEINADIERAKTKYSKFTFDYTKKNSSYTRIVGKYDLEFLHRIPKPADLSLSDVSLIQQLEKCLALDRLAINLHSKAIEEISKDKEIRFKESLNPFKEKMASYKKIIEKSIDLLVEFQKQVNRKDKVADCILEEKLSPLRKEIRLNQMDLERIYMDVFEGTAMMTGKMQESTDAEAQAEAF